MKKLKEYSINEILNNFIFLEEVPDFLKKTEGYLKGYINGVYGIAFLGEAGISLRILDAGFGNDEYFEIYPLEMDFSKDIRVFPLKGYGEIGVKIFDEGIVLSNPIYKQIFDEISNKSVF